jgi:hypothetical protein
MNNIVQTKSGEIIEILNGTLICENKIENWITISDWMLALDEYYRIKLSIEVAPENKLWITIPETTPVHKLESLLQHFCYQ